MKIKTNSIGILVVSFVFLLLVPSLTEAHHSGCHQWHSCPSDRGTYICGDIGYCGQCSDNQFCRNGQPIAQSTSSPIETLQRQLEGKGVLPLSKSSCPSDHPIKGNLTTKTGECIYHVPGGAFYGRTNPELCFATEKEAMEAGCRRSKR